MNSISWQAQETPEELHTILRTLGEEYPIKEDSENDISVTFVKKEKPGTILVSCTGNQAIVEYSQPHHAARGIGTILSGIVEEGSDNKETSPFSTLGIMLDCSRNAVMKVEHFKGWLRQLTLFGYNMAMLYTEDTYSLPGEDYFGYMRGRYTENELIEINDYARKLGIEMIGCIQTLGHLGQILQWLAYSDIKDTSSVMLVDEQKTYELIDKMVATWSKVFPTRRIHVGMDETHDLGRGRFMDKHGYERGFDIFNRHLGKVVEICEKHGMKPMIWSDMYFRMGSKTQNYYDPECSIPDDVKTMIPKQAELVYWDYYHRDEDFYSDWISRHRALGFEPIMGSGVWTWSNLWYNHHLTEVSVPPCVNACKKANLSELFFTLWGDDGGYCDFDSSLAGLSFAAEYAYAEDEPDVSAIAARFNTICGGNYHAHLLASKLNVLQVEAVEEQLEDNRCILSAGLLWDDPLLGILWNNLDVSYPQFYDSLKTQYTDLENELNDYIVDTKAGNLKHAFLIVQALKKKLAIRHKLVESYAQNDQTGLQAVRGLIPDVIDSLNALLDSFRTQWMSRNKPFGLEVIQIRLSGLISRYNELNVRLTELIQGDITSIPELDEKPTQKLDAVSNCYHGLATGSIIL